LHEAENFSQTIRKKYSPSQGAVDTMPKSRHHKRKQKNKPASLLFNLTKELERIGELIEAGNLPEALDDLKTLAALRE
jgi:hypothetical protein